MKYLLYIFICTIIVALRDRILFILQKRQKLDRERKDWLYNQLIQIFDLFGYSNEINNYEVRSILNQVDRFDHSVELIAEKIPEKLVFAIPDISYAEKELIDMEQRIAKSLVILVSAPVIFIILGFVYYFTPSVMILNGIILIILIEFLTFEMRNPYKLTGWGATLHDIKQFYQKLEVDPFGTLVVLKEYFHDVYSIELSILPMISEGNPPNKALGALFSIAIKNDPLITKEIFKQFLEATKDLPKVEDIHKKKWAAYSTQFVFITTAIIFFSAILGSIASLTSYIIDELQNQPKFANQFFFNPSRYTAEFSMVITLIIAYILSKPFLNKNTRKMMISFWVLEYLIILYTIIYSFRLLISGTI